MITCIWHIAMANFPWAVYCEGPPSFIWGRGWGAKKRRHYYCSLQLTYTFKTRTIHKKLRRLALCAFIYQVIKIRETRALVPLIQLNPSLKWTIEIIISVSSYQVADVDYVVVSYPPPRKENLTRNLVEYNSKFVFTKWRFHSKLITIVCTRLQNYGTQSNPAVVLMMQK